MWCDIIFIVVKLENNIFNWGAVGVLRQPLDLQKIRRLVPMVTYTDLFTFVIMLCTVITLVRRKK